VVASLCTRTCSWAPGRRLLVSLRQAGGWVPLCSFACSHAGSWASSACRWEKRARPCVALHRTGVVQDTYAWCSGAARIPCFWCVVCVHACVQMCVYVCVCARTCVCMRVCMCARPRVHAHVCACECACISARASACVRLFACVCLCVHTQWHCCRVSGCTGRLHSKVLRNTPCSRIYPAVNQVYQM